MDVQDFLAHHGVLGMHWGVRKEAPTVKKAAKPKRKESIFGFEKATGKKGDLTPQQTVNQTALGGGIAVAGYGSYFAGQHFLNTHPEITARTYNFVHGRKAIGTGHPVVKLILKKGVYVLK